MIIEFIGQYRFLSNFSKHPFTINGVLYRTNEHHFQSYKADNRTERELIINASRAGEAKAIGRSVSIVKDWDLIKEQVMWLGLVGKFGQHRTAKAKLIATGTQKLMEGNRWHDNYWGNCFCHECKEIKGLNRLGELLMMLRVSYGGY